MSSDGFGGNDVRLGEALYRAEGHCLACAELYIDGRPVDAILQATRPIADVLPWLETDLRSALAGLRSFTVAVAQLGAEARRNAKPRVMRRAFQRVGEARAALLDEAVGRSAADESFRASVAIALLQTLRDTYGDALRSESLNGYQSAYGIARVAIELLTPSLRATPVEGDLAVLNLAFPSVQPPEGLWRAQAIDDAIERVRAFSLEKLDAISSDPTLEDSLGKIDRLLADVARSYEDQPALAARLAASLFVRSFDPVREELQARAPAAAERLTNLLGIELRRAINDGVPHRDVAALVDEGRSVLGDIRAESPHPA